MAFKFWHKKEPTFKGYFQMLDGYTPVFYTYDGGVYEMELTRACIHAFANHASKLQPQVNGSAKAGLQKVLDGKPNPWMTTAQFVYKCATIYDTQNTCFILPMLNDKDETVGFYPANPLDVEVLDHNGEPWLRFEFRDGTTGAIEFSRCGVISKFLYRNDIKGESNRALDPTLELINMQNQGITEGIKNNSRFSFFATSSNFAKAKDLSQERQNFTELNFGPDKGGVLLFPNTYSGVQQVTSQAKIVDPEQMQIIQTRVYNYFGINEDILQNKSIGDTWSAFYEGKIEPFAIQLSQAMTCMVYSEHELSFNNGIVWSSNRLQYMTNKEKAEVSSQMFDRGIFNRNMVNDVWNLPHTEGGDTFYIRKEYIEVSKLDDKGDPEEPPTEPEQDPEQDPAVTDPEGNTKEDDNDPAGED